MGKGYLRFVFFLQCLFTLFFGSIIVHTFFFLRENNGLSIETVMLFAPKLLVLIFAIFPHFLIKIRHKSHTQDGEILPLLFLAMTLECFSLIPEYYIETGILLLDPIIVNTLIRLAFLLCPLMFLLSSLLYQGSSVSKIGQYILIAIIASFLLSYAAPHSSSPESAVNSFGSLWDIYFNIASLTISSLAILTFVITMINDKVLHTAKRAIAFILMIIGNWGIFAPTSIVATILLTIVYIIGVIMMIVTNKDSF